MFDPNSPNTNKRAYQLQTIEKQQSAVTGSGKSLAVSKQTVAIANIADLFAYVKQNDNNFKPNPAGKIINGDGTPKVMYHGTSSKNGDFYVFDSSKATKKGGLGFKALGSGNYFTSKVLNGTERYGDRVIEAYLDIKNPYEYSGGVSFKTEVCNLLGLNENISYDELQNEMRARGYDGIIQYDKNNEISIAVTFDSNQIKSTDNIGTFDKNNPDIRYFTKKDMPLEAVFGFYSDVVRENKAWSLLNNMLEIQTNSARKGIHLRRKDIETVAKKLIKDNSSTMTVEELYMRANSVRPYTKHCFIVLFLNAQDSVPYIST